MTPDEDLLDSLAVSDDLIDEAVSRLDIFARLVGRHGALFLDVWVPKDAGALPPPLAFLMRAAAELHTEIQASDELSDIEETLEDVLKADDRHGIEEGCEIYRSLLASRLKAIWRGKRGLERLEDLGAWRRKPWLAELR